MPERPFSPVSITRGRPTPATDDEPARSQLSSWYAQGFSDGFGDRLLMFDNAATGPLELLRVRPDFAIVPAFESALRARVERLSSFAHPGFAQVRAVNHLDNGEGLTVVSSHVAGTRLSELFQPNRPHPGMHPASVRWALDELLGSLAELHRCGRDIAHGTLSLDRIVITADRHVVITDYAFGDALAVLRLPADRLWSEFGLVPAPGTGTVQFDQRGDVVQAALVVLSLVLGRRVSPAEFPHLARELLDELTVACNRRAADVTPQLRAWLEAALDPAGFRTAGDAERGLVEPIRLPVASAPAAQSHAPRSAGAEPPPRVDLPAPIAAADLFEETADEVIVAVSKPVWLWVAAGLAAVCILQAAVIVRLLTRPAAPPQAVHITIDSATPGDTVLVDGKEAGTTPLDLPLEGVNGPIRVVPQPPEPVPGAVLAMSESPEPEPAGTTSALAVAAQATGGLRIVSPIPLRIVEDDKLLGSSATGPIFTAPGVHHLELINDELGFRTRQTVRVTAGRVVPLDVTPPNGSLSVNARPWAQVFVDGRAIGDTPLANVPVPPGEHEVVFRHPQYGERRQKVVVQASTDTRVSVSLTQ